MSLITLLGISFVAAFMGTAVMTIGQEIQIRITKRPFSYTPAIAVFKIFHLNFDKLTARMKVVMSYVAHFGYGTLWGFPLALFFLFDLRLGNMYLVGVIYFIIILLQGWILLPLLGVAGPVWTWGWKSVLMEVCFKFVYAAVTVITFLAIYLTYSAINIS